LFIAGNLVCALSSSYAMLLLGRLISAFCHGAFYGAASVAAGMVVSIEFRARALAVVSAGVMVANVIGVPAGTALGQLVGWRAAFWGVSGLGVIAMLVLLAVLPRTLAGRQFSLASEVRALFRPQVLIGLSVSLCFTIGLFSCFPYLTPLLTSVSGARPDDIPLLLMVFGAGATVAVLAGGRLADWRLRSTLGIAFGAQIAVYVAVAAFSGNLNAMWMLMFAIGVAAMLAVAPLRVVVLTAAFDAPALASTMTSSAFNLGVALGAALGAALLEFGLSYTALPFAGAAFAACGLGLLPFIRTTKGAMP
jgi:DHA1 family inner membrane transport protein